jgi:uroporphyrinogen decarboxylase
MNSVYKNLLSSLSFQEPETVLFVIWNTAPLGTSLAEVKQKEFYLNDELKLTTQLNLQKLFPDAMLFPGPFPDFGAVLEPSLFGCEIKWPEDDAPSTVPLIHDIEAVNRLKVPANLKNAGLMPVMLRQYEYMWKHLSSEYIDGYGYLNGLGYMLGPLETAATIMNYSNFLIELILNPQLIHKLLDITTETIIQSLRLQQNINGKIKRLFMADHMAHQVSPAMFEEFCFPYYKRIFDEFTGVEIGLYHNEGNIQHVADRIPAFGANVIHYGAVTKTIKEKTYGRATLMGNLPTIEIMLNGSPEDVYQAAINCLQEGAPGGGFLLSTAGGMAPKTPLENIKSAINATRDFSIARKYQIKQ